MEILSVNRILNWLQILSDKGRKYTCSTKLVDGKLFFLFKNSWHEAAKYITNSTKELVKENGEIIFRSLKK